MDIAGLSTALSISSLQNQVGVAMVSKDLDAKEALGQGLVEMIDAAAMERSVHPELGSNMDVKI